MKSRTAGRKQAPGTSLLMALALPALLLALLTAGLGVAQGQGETPQRRLEIAALDVSRFPEVGVNLIVTDPRSRPVRELRAVRLRESGRPIADYDVVQQTVGTDLFVVLDANSRIQEADDESGVTRLQKVKDSILAYSGRFMDLAGRDRVWVVAPDGEEGRVLAENVALPGELIEAVQPYDVGRLPASDVMALLAMALELAAAEKEEGRFQAVVVYTDGAGLNEARYDPLIERAQALQAPIFVLLLGGGTTPNENAVQAATALATPTRGFFAPMPTASDSSEVFQVIADNGVQTQLRYESNVRRSGAYSVTVTLENLRDQTTLALELAPPDVRLEAPAMIQRAGTEPDAPLETLQPEVQPVAVEISWPDGLPRRLQGAALLANGEAQEAPFFGGETVVQFEWRIAELDAGRYELTVVVTDVLGLAGRSERQAVTIALSRPEAAPTPAPTPTPEPMEALRELLPALPAWSEMAPLAAPVGGALLALLAVVLISRRLRARRAGQERAASPPDGDEDEAAADVGGSGERAMLTPLGGAPEQSSRPLLLEGTNVTIGSAEGEVQLVMQERSVSGFHARIRRTGGAYWLYDEGSEHGTFLNHERLGLAPRELRDGDEVQLGGVRLRFGVEREGKEQVAHVGREGEGEER